MAAIATGRIRRTGQLLFPRRSFFLCETSVAQYAFRMTRHIIVCTGMREPAGVKLSFYKVL